MKPRKLLTAILTLYIVLIKFSIVFASSPEIYAEGAVLIDAKTGVVLYDKNMHENYYPASITKIMTALLAIENCEDDERVYMSKNAIFGIERASSNIAMDVGETLSVEDALYGIMLASANEVSMAVGEHISGDIETFADLMTERATELGALSTSFMNPHGLPDDNHYTTPYDMAQIMRKAVTYEKFTDIISTRGYKIPPTERQPLERPLNNHHKMIQPGEYYYEYVIGGKTGYTDIARNTLVTYAIKDDIELIAVVMKSALNVTYTETKDLFEYGFNLYHLAHIFDKDSYSDSIPISGADSEASIVPLKSLTVKVPNQINSANVTIRPEIPNTLPKSTAVGDTAGKLIILFEGEEIAETDLIVDKITILEKEEKQEENKASVGDEIEEPEPNGIRLWQIILILLTLVISVGACIYASKVKILSRYFKRG